MRISTLAFAVSIAGCISLSAASFTHNFVVGDVFDGDGVGDTAAVPAGPDTVTFTTIGVAPNGVLNVHSSTGLGLDAAADTFGNAFDDGEAWTLIADTALELEGIDFDVFSTATEQFAFQSSAFIGLSLTPGAPQITFDSVTGTFNFTSSSADDDFDLNELSGGVVLPISAGTAMTFSFTDSASGAARIDSFTFNAVPEPSLSLLAAFYLLYLLRGRRR